MFDVVDEFFEQYATDHADSTVANHRSSLREFSAFLETRDLEPDQVDAEHIRHYLVRLERKGYADQTIRGRYHSLQLLFSYLVNSEYVCRDPTESVRVGKFASRRSRRNDKSEHQCPWISREEVNHLVESVPQPVVRNQCLLLFMYYTACRGRTASQLEVSAISLEKRQARVLRNGSTVTVRWQPDLTPLLRKWLNEYRPEYPTASASEHVFLTEQSTRIHPRHVSRIVKQAARKAGIQEVLYTDQRGYERKKVTADTLRHSFAVHWLSPPAPGSVERLRELLGVSDSQSSEVYERAVAERFDSGYRESAHSVDVDTKRAESRQCCPVCGRRKARIEVHHVSYDPERTLEVCQNCHLAIHGTDRHPSLKPDGSRKD